MAIGPAVGRLVEPDQRQAQLIAEHILINGIEDREGDARQILGRGNTIEQHGLVAG